VFDLIGKRRWFYLFSALITVPGFIFIILTFLTNGQEGLKFSIDFTGGTVIEVHFARETQPTPAEVREVLAEQGLEGTVAVTTSGDRHYVLIRTEALGLIEQPPATASPAPTASGSPAASSSVSPAPSPSAGPSTSASAAPSTSAVPSASPLPSASAVASAGASPSPSASPAPALPTTGKLGELRAALEAKFGKIDEVRQQATIGPLISAELAQQTIVLIILGSIGILAWMTFRFRDFRMGMAALAALLHDVIVVVGTFAILGTFTGLEVDALFVTAMLTVIGFSVHDTIVVFDRIRENRIRHAGEPFAAIVNHSLLQTLGRSLNTSLTTILVLTALLLFGSDAIRAFVFAMVIGILSGTYSSIFNASMLLVTWQEWSERRREQVVAAAARAR
jgi:preprotein translocase SecF subunit